MKKRKLTDPFIRSIKAPEKRIEISDRQTQGLALRVTSTGYKSFVFRYRYVNEVKRYTIGKYPAVNLALAREKARELSVQVSDGIDPLEVKKSKMRKPDITSVKELIEDFKRDYLPKKKKSTQNTYKSRIKKIEGRFGKLGVDDVTRHEVKRFLKEIAAKQPVNANRVQAIFSKIYSYANKEGFTTNHPLKGLEKVGGKEKSRNPIYTNEDVRNLWDAFQSQDEPLSSLLMMLLITGQRLGETSRMKWSQVDYDNGLWIIPEEETKGKKVHVVPLTNMALKVIESLKVHTGELDYVFSSPRRYNKPMTHFQAVTERVRTETSLPDFKIHDLRHIVITGMVRIGVDFVHVGKTVAHKGLGKDQFITSRYAQYEYMDEKRRALGRWAGELNRIINETEGTKVFKLGG